MWFRKKNPAGRVVKRLVTGLIIGGAIGSVVGKHLLDKHDETVDEDAEVDDGNDVD